MNMLTTEMLRGQLQQILHALDAMEPDTKAQPLQALANPARTLAQARNAVITAGRADVAPGPPDVLERLNGLASVMASLEYPLGGVHWQRIETLRKELGALIREMETG
ncbi:MAG: hypothetical protein ACJ8G3_12845 [Burkholderiaceae bacterium]